MEVKWSDSTWWLAEIESVLNDNDNYNVKYEEGKNVREKNVAEERIRRYEGGEKHGRERRRGMASPDHDIDNRSTKRPKISQKQQIAAAQNNIVNKTTTGFKCTNCDRVFTTHAAVSGHKRYCKPVREEGKERQNGSQNAVVDEEDAPTVPSGPACGEPYLDKPPPKSGRKSKGPKEFWNKKLQRMETKGKSGLLEPRYFQPEDIIAVPDHITDAIVLEALEYINVPKTLRLNTKLNTKDQKYGMCIGAIKTYFKGVCASQDCVSRPKLTDLLVRWMRQHKPDFHFTSIQVNKDYQSALHVDSNNMGPSYIVGLGDYIGGELWQEGRGALDVKGKFVETDGNVPHATLPFAGTRYTLVFFTHQSWALTKQEHKEQLANQFGFPLPPLSMEMASYGDKYDRLHHGKRKWNAFLKSVECPAPLTKGKKDAAELRAYHRRVKNLQVHDTKSRVKFYPLLIAEWKRMKLPMNCQAETVERFCNGSELWGQMQAATITRLNMVEMAVRFQVAGKKRR